MVFKVKKLKIFLVSAFLVLAILSLGGYGAQVACLDFSGIKNTCNTLSGSISMILHHLTQIENLAPAIISSTTLSILLLLIFAGLFITYVFLRKIPKLIIFFSKTRNKTVGSVFVYKAQFLRWLSFHYKRDPHAL